MLRERHRDAVLIVAQRDLVRHRLELRAGVAHRDAVAREVEHAHIVLRIAERHDLSGRYAETLTDAAQRLRLRDALRRTFVEPRRALHEIHLLREALADVGQERHERLVLRRRENLRGRNALRLDGVRDVVDDLHRHVVVAALVLHLVVVGAGREDRLAVVDDRRDGELLKMAQEPHGERVRQALVEKDLVRRRILDAPAVVREQEAVMLREVECLRLALEARRLAARGEHHRHALRLYLEQRRARLRRDFLRVIVERAVEIERDHLILLFHTVILSLNEPFFPHLSGQGEKGQGSADEIGNTYICHATQNGTKRYAFQNLLCRDATPRTHRRNKKARPHRT